MGINVLSFFDGISAGQQSLKSLGVEVDNYIAIEIDPVAKKVTRKNFPNTIFWGDITELEESEEFYKSLPKIDLVFAGSPCQGFSKGGRMRGLEDPRSALFNSFMFVFNTIKDIQNNPHIPFFFENVVMDQYWREIISSELGVKQPSKIQASDYSATSRDRLYWTNMRIPINIMNKYATGKEEVYQDILIEKKRKMSLNRVIIHREPERTIKRKHIKNKVNKYREEKTEAGRKKLDRQHSIYYTETVAKLIKDIALGKKTIESVFGKKSVKVIKVPNTVYWKETSNSLSMANIKYQQSHGWRINRINRKIPCLVTNAQGFDNGLGVFGFPKKYFRSDQLIKISKMGTKTRSPIILFPPEKIQQKLKLNDDEYIACRIMYKEALVALGFPSNYFDGVDISNTEKIKSIGNSWSVVVVKLIIDWSLRDVPRSAR
jgi:site-specific DNA-cytosine methylase